MTAYMKISDNEKFNSVEGVTIQSEPASKERRKFLMGASAALGAACFPASLFAKSGDPILKLGYLPITDAAPLLIAHALGYFREEGINAPRPVMGTTLV